VVDKHLAQPENGPYYVLEELEMEDGQTARWKTEPTTVSVEAGNRSTNNKNNNNNPGGGGRRSMSVNQGSGRSKNRGKGKGSSSTDAVAGAAVDPQRHHHYHHHQNSDEEREGSDSQVSLVEHDGITVEQEVVISESYLHVRKTE